MAGLLGGVLNTTGAGGRTDFSRTGARARASCPNRADSLTGKLHHSFGGGVDRGDWSAHTYSSGSGPIVSKTGSLSAVDDQFIFRTAGIT